MKRIAVVILNYNGADMLRRFLTSVVSFSPDAEVYVADNASTDASCAVVITEFPTVRLIRLDKNYGFAEGYNRALAFVNEEYVVLLNSDVEVTPDWLSPMTEYLDAHADVAACQPKILAWRNKSQFEYAGAAGGFIDRWGYPYCRGRIFDTVEYDEGQYDDIVDIFWATGAALMVRNADYKELGGLDGTFFAHMEEIDFCWRLHSRGRRIVCVPQSRVYHVGGATLSKENPRKTYLNFRNNLIMIYKNAPADKLRAMLRFRTIFDNVAALKFLATGNVAAFKAIRNARRDFRRLRAYYDAKRADNLAFVTQNDIPEMLNDSILRLYYLKSKHKYSSL